MEMTKKKAVVLVGMALASTSAFAGELNSFTSEVVSNDYDGGKQATEWTIGKGSYNLTDDYKFLFDVDKDYVEDDGEKTQGWDTQFGIAQKLDQVAGFDLTMYYLGRYDASWNAADGSDDSYTAQYIVSPYFSKDITLADKEFSFGIELWAQVGESDGSSLEDISGVETNFYLDGALSDNWDLSLAWYNFNYYDTDEKEYDYQVGTEDYLTYTLPLGSGFSFILENYVEAYYTPDSEAVAVYAHVEPKISFKKKVNDNFSWHAAVSYEAARYDYSDSASDSSSESYNNNEMELVVGFTVR